MAWTGILRQATGTPFDFLTISRLTCVSKQHIEYAKSKSWATLKQEDPNFVPGIGTTNVPAPPKGGEKRPRETDANDPEERAAKRKGPADIAEEEMEIEDDD